MKLTLILISGAIICSCTTEKPVLHLLHYDGQNNRVTEDGQLVPWTNFGIGFRQGTNWIELIRATEKP